MNPISNSTKLFSPSSIQFDVGHTISTVVIGSARVIPNVISDPFSVSIYDLYISLNPIISSFWVTLGLICFQITISFLTSTISINDRLWPFIPLIHALLFTFHPVLSCAPDKNCFNARLFIMCMLVFMWSVRLFIHAWYRGVYKKGMVDYRYKWIKQNIISNNFIYSMFHVFFTCTALTVLLSTISSGPCYFAWIVSNNQRLNFLDGIACFCMLLGIIIESISDSQQQQFQKNKNETQNDGFIQTGLFSRCRHPNFVGEIIIWFSFYLFTISSGAGYLNWLLIGPVSYFLVFQGSTTITEHISMKKYPKYKEYKAKVPCLYFSIFANNINQTSKQKQI